MSPKGTSGVKSSLGFRNLLFTMNFSYLGTYVKSKHIHVLSNSEAEVERVWHVQEKVYARVFLF